MPNFENKLSLTPLAFGDARQVRSLRVGYVQGRAQLFTLSQAKVFETVLSVVSLDGHAPPVHLLPLASSLGLPQWDVFPVGVERPPVVWTKPGSASCSLQYRSASGKEADISGQYPNDVFTNPRFVRGDVRSPDVTAVRSGDVSRTSVLFSGELEASPTVQVLPAMQEGTLEQQLLLRSGTESYLLVKTRSGLATPERHDGSGLTLQAGQLHLVHISEKQGIIGQWTKPLGDTPIYEFDADVSESRLVLAATTASGLLATSAHAGREGLQWSGRAEMLSPSALLSPSLAIAGPDALVATLTSIGTAEARVLTAHIRVAP